MPQARGEDAGQGAEAPPGALELRHAARAVDAGVDHADRAADDRVGLDALLFQVPERADVVRPEGGAPTQDEDPLLALGHAAVHS